MKLHPYAKIAAGIYGAARGIGVWVERRSCLKANQAQVESCYIAAAFARKRAGDTVPESWKGWMSPETKEMMRKHRQL